MKKNLLYLGVVPWLLIGGVAQADTVFTYDLHLPNITNSVEDDSAFTQYAFSWKGPLMFNSAAGTACPTVCGPVVPGSTVTPGESFAGFSFTADLTLSESEVLVNFSDGGSNTVTFKLIEPDSFWSTTGTGLAFPSAKVGEGATFSVDSGTSAVCNKCTVDISESTATPEPRSSILLATLMAAAGLLVQRRRRQSKTIS
jgi:hypothetical protein